MKKGKIYIYGPIGGPNGVSSEWISQWLDYLKNENGVDAFIVYINSPGGSYAEAIAIYNVLKGYDVEVKITGTAASAAALVAMAGEKIGIAENSFMMVHNVMIDPESSDRPDRQYYKKYAENLEKYGQAMLNIFTEKTGKSETDIQTLLDKETLMTASEAVAQGFADEVLSVAQVNQEVQNYVLIKPKQISNPSKKESSMDPKELRQNLNLPETATDDEVKAKLDEIRVKVEAEAKAEESKETQSETTTSTPTVEDRIKTLEDGAVQSQKDTFEAQVDRLVNTAINDFRILPADKEIYLNAARQEFDKTKVRLEAIPKNAVKPGNITTLPDGTDKVSAHDKLTAYLKTQGRTPQVGQAG